jgi:hypothetical protein
MSDGSAASAGSVKSERKLSEMETTLSATLGELAQARRNETLAKRAHYDSLQDGLVRGIEEQLEDVEEIRRMISGFRDMLEASTRSVSDNQ